MCPGPGRRTRFSLNSGLGTPPGNDPIGEGSRPLAVAPLAVAPPDPLRLGQRIDLSAHDGQSLLLGGRIHQQMQR